MLAFDSLADFIAMGRHGVFVWSAYAVAVLVVLYNQISPRLMQRQLVAEHQRRQRRERQAAESAPTGAQSE